MELSSMVQIYGHSAMYSLSIQNHNEISSLALKIEAANSSKTVVPIYQKNGITPHNTTNLTFNTDSGESDGKLPNLIYSGVFN
jgi:hypothetical protein